MKYYSLTDKSLRAGFSEALLASLAPDGGLWMPESLPRFTDKQMAGYGALSFADCAAMLARFFIDDNFTDVDLLRLCRDAYDFPLPLRSFDGYVLDPAMAEVENEFILELFHGPTLAFKDFAARFMGRAASHIMGKTGESRTILVATSGDTGGAVGEAFLNQPGIDVFILFPKNGVSQVQEQQLCTIGGGNSNVHAIAIDGSFDDCQSLVKQAFADKQMNEKYQLMSANSINVGRVIPQSFYYFWTSLQIKAAYPGLRQAFSIPSGNLGNLTGGLIAKQMGAPIDRFIIGNNSNDPFVDYLETGKYTPRPSIPTLSNAMDIGRPNNFPRIMELFGGDYDAIREVCWGQSFDDEQTARHIRRMYKETGYIMCPHTAIGHMAMDSFSTDIDTPFIKVTVSTAHPAKFADIVERTLHETLPMPEPLQNALNHDKIVHIMAPQIEALDKYIISKKP